MEKESIEGKVEDLRDAINVLQQDVEALETAKRHLQMSVDRVAELRKDLYNLVN